MKTTIKNLSAVIAGLYAEKVAAEQVAVDLHEKLQAPCNPANCACAAQASHATFSAEAIINYQRAGLRHIANLMGGPNEVCQILTDGSPVELSPEQITLIHEVFGGSGEPVPGRGDTTRADLQFSLKAQTDLMERMAEALERQKSRLDELADVAAQRLKAVADLQDTLATRDAETQKLVDQVNEANVLLTNRQGQIVELQISLAQRDGLIADLRQQLHAQEARSYDQIESLNNQLKTLQANYDMLEHGKKRALEALDAKTKKDDELVREKVTLKGRMAEAAASLSNVLITYHVPPKPEAHIQNVIKELRK